MTMPRFASAVLLLLTSSNALAVHLGQLTTTSHLGEVLAARVELYAPQAADSATLAVELLPEIGAMATPAEHAVANSIVAELRQDAGGRLFVALSSSVPVDQAAVSFRLRLHAGSGAVVRHYTLALAGASSTAVARPPFARAASTRPQMAPPLATAPAVATTGAGAYGPVRAGQSLWRIMQERGLTAGNPPATMAWIVAANPTAFIAGDADRLRVGAHLTLPTGAADALPLAAATISGSEQEQAKPATTATTATVAADPSANTTTAGAALAPLPGTDADAVDPVIAARLAALAEKFAAIRTRYAAQQAAATERATTTPATRADAEQTSATVASSAPAAPLAAEADMDVEVDAEQLAAAPARSAAALWWLLAAIVLVVLVFSTIKYIVNVYRPRRAAAVVFATDKDLVVEIGRKAEKRLQLEGEVKRMIAGKRENAPAAARAAALVVEREAAALSPDSGSTEEIETRIAHGQYAEAEVLLEQVIAQTPNNFRAKLRLAEIYYLNERHEEFVRIADEIYRKHRPDIGDDNWQRVMRMGKVIAPDRPPFSGPVAIGNTSKTA